MEERGIVGPFEGSKPRQLLISRERWQELQMAGGLGTDLSELPQPAAPVAGVDEPPF
jgi:S-DNA-T family DNA segregation ATPase FtsK/SpoIIIE